MNRLAALTGTEAGSLAGGCRVRPVGWIVALALLLVAHACVRKPIASFLGANSLQVVREGLSPVHFVVRALTEHHIRYTCLVLHEPFAIMTGTLSVEYLEKIVALSERLRDEWQQVNKKYKERHQVRKLHSLNRLKQSRMIVEARNEVGKTYLIAAALSKIY